MHSKTKYYKCLNKIIVSFGYMLYELKSSDAELNIIYDL